ncbi:hypothetical protein [Sphingobium sp.]|uniref:hypothetical protein n=1 Tax=Sphingobium sp. TaxID=1912891 RepID=UPI002D8032E1|nr:hypothetical protein [Sphingobium sp.]
MTTRHLIDPKIASVLDFLPELDLGHESLPAIRAGMMPPIDYPGPVATPDIRAIPGRDGAPDVPLHIFNADPARPGRRASCISMAAPPRSAAC